MVFFSIPSCPQFLEKLRSATLGSASASNKWRMIGRWPRCTATCKGWPTPVLSGFTWWIWLKFSCLGFIAGRWGDENVKFVARTEAIWMDGGTFGVCMAKNLMLILLATKVFLSRNCFSNRFLIFLECFLHDQSVFAQNLGWIFVLVATCPQCWFQVFRFFFASQMSSNQFLVTFHCAAWLVGILIMPYYNPYI